MKTQTLWYLRRHGQVRGPYPARLLTRDLLLGRIDGRDEVSIDQVFWQPVSEVQALQPMIPVKAQAANDAEIDWRAERLRAARRWADERRGRERRQATDRVAQNRRRGDRRRHQEDVQLAVLRARHEAWEAAMRCQRERFWGVAALLILLTGLAVYGAFNFARVNPLPVRFMAPAPACEAPAAPQVNWRGCDKSGAWLKGVDLASAVLHETRLNAANLSHSNLAYANLIAADLTFANLTQARLTGADLSQANLAYAELRDADLRHADLRGAQVAAATLVGARLDHALWVDGRRCAVPSVGECR